MINNDMPMFVQLAARQKEALEAEKARKDARAYENGLKILFAALERVFGGEAASEISAMGYTAQVNSAYVWRFDRFGFKPYNYSCATDDDSKWFNFAVLASSDLEEQTVLIGFNAVDSMHDVIEKIEYADRHYASKKKVKTIEPEFKDTPASLFFAKMSYRLKTLTTLTYFEDMIVAAFGMWKSSDFYDQDDENDESDDE